MRIPIVEYPKIVTASLKHFGPAFQTAAQRQHYCQYVTGLIAGDKGTVQAINNLFLGKQDQSVLNKFMTQEEWSELELNERRIEFELARLYRRPVSIQAGRLIIDDTLAHHKQGAIEGLAYLKDHTLNRYVWAHDVVTAHYVNRQDQFPVDFRLYHQFRVKYENEKLRQAAEQLATNPTLSDYQQHLLNLLSYRLRQQTFQTKTQSAGELVQEAVRWGIPFKLVLWDSWFSRKPLIEQVEKADKDWIGGCPKDRKVLYQGQWQPLETFITSIPADAYRPVKINHHLYWLFAKNLPAQFLNRRKLRFVAVYDTHLNLDKTPLFYVGNRLDWEAKRIFTTYLDRWPTETLNQDVKGNLAFADVQLRRERGIKRHWYLSFVAYSLLGNQGLPGRSRWTVRGQFQSTGQRCQLVVDELLGYLVDWIVRQHQGGQSPELILQRLLA
jgi:hypothetical protein